MYRKACVHIFTVALFVTMKAWRDDTNKTVPKDFLVVQQLRLHTPSAGGAWLRSLIVHAATKDPTCQITKTRVSLIN